MGGHVVQAGRMWRCLKFVGAGGMVLIILGSAAIAAVSSGAGSKQEKTLAQSTPLMLRIHPHHS